MPYWLTVYCRKRVSSLTPDQLVSGIRSEDPIAMAGADYDTLAEDYGIADSLVSPALKALRAVPGNGNEFDCDLRYGGDGDRPVRVEGWFTPGRVRAELSEVQESALPTGVPQWLSACVEVVGIELGISQFEDMGVVFAYELARYLAQRGDGVIRDDDERWQYVDRHGGFSAMT